MRAIVIEGGARLALRDVPAPAAPGECTIRVRLAGICGTDLQLLQGYAGFTGIPGHEFVGEVVSADGAGDDEWIGRRVVGEINVGCGACAFCSRGIKEHCVARTVVGIIGRGGAFAEYLTLPARNLHHVPAEIDDQSAVFVEPVAAACRILEQIEIKPGMRVAVLGDGRLGLLIAQVLRSATGDVTVLGRHDEKLAIAGALGLIATRTADAGRTRYDIVVEATGRAAGLRDALSLAEPRGVVVLKSTFHGLVEASTWPAVVDEITLVGSRCGPFRPAIELLRTGAVQVKPLVARVAPLADFESAFAEARRGLKILLDPAYQP